MVQGMVGVESSFAGLEFEELENEGGSCPVCRTRAALWTCSECGTSAWVIDCAHRRAPAWLRRGRRDGSARARFFCGECADVMPAMQQLPRALPLPA
ncbi:MAG TPA: hypothetical protein VGL86_18770 [Polyangia bacterium]|jgi:hypothetical protein